MSTSSSSTTSDTGVAGSGKKRPRDDVSDEEEDAYTDSDSEADGDGDGDTSDTDASVASRSQRDGTRSPIPIIKLEGGVNTPLAPPSSHMGVEGGVSPLVQAAAAVPAGLVALAAAAGSSSSSSSSSQHAEVDAAAPSATPVVPVIKPIAQAAAAPATAPPAPSHAPMVAGGADGKGAPSSTPDRKVLSNAVMFKPVKMEKGNPQGIDSIYDVRHESELMQYLDGGHFVCAPPYPPAASSSSAGGSGGGHAHVYKELRAMVLALPRGARRYAKSILTDELADSMTKEQLSGATLSLALFWVSQAASELEHKELLVECMTDAFYKAMFDTVTRITKVKGGASAPAQAPKIADAAKSAEGDSAMVAKVAEPKVSKETKAKKKAKTAKEGDDAADEAKETKVSVPQYGPGLMVTVLRFLKKNDAEMKVLQAELAKFNSTLDGPSGIGGGTGCKLPPKAKALVVAKRDALAKKFEVEYGRQSRAVSAIKAWQTASNKRGRAAP
jgi:hypothetical protein